MFDQTACAAVNSSEIDHRDGGDPQPVNTHRDEERAAPVTNRSKPTSQFLPVRHRAGLMFIETPGVFPSDGSSDVDRAFLSHSSHSHPSEMRPNSSQKYQA